MAKTDYKKSLKHLYGPTKTKVVEVDVPPMNFLMIDGKGNPNTSQEFQDAIETLYPMAFTLKFMVKKADAANDYVVPPLEGLWWAKDMNAFDAGNKDEWLWTLMIMQPEHVTPDMVEQARAEVLKKKNPPALDKLRFEELHEGRSAQILHVGPFEDEAPTIEKVHAFIEEAGCQRNGKHHEIYLSDFRRTAPEKLRTVIRQPME